MGHGRRRALPPRPDTARCGAQDQRSRRGVGSQWGRRRRGRSWIADSTRRTLSRLDPASLAPRSSSPYRALAMESPSGRGGLGPEHPGGVGVQGLAQPGAGGPRDSRRGRWDRRGRRRRQRLGHGSQARRGGEDRPRLRSRPVDRRGRRADGCVRHPGRSMGRQQRSRTVSRIDPSTGKVVATVVSRGDRTGSPPTNARSGLRSSVPRQRPPSSGAPQDDLASAPEPSRSNRPARARCDRWSTTVSRKRVLSRLPSQRTSGIKTSRLGSIR